MLKHLCRLFVFPNLHFLTFATIFLIFGILYAHCSFNYLYLFLIIIAAISYCVVMKLINRNTFYYLIALSGLIFGIFAYHHQINNQKSFFELIQKNRISLTATVQEVDDIQNSRFNYKIKVYTDTIFMNGKEFAIHATLLLYVKKNSDLQIGDYIQLNDLTFKKPQNSEYNLYLLKEKIIASSFIDSFEYTLLVRQPIHPGRSIFNLRKSLFDTLQSNMDGATFKLFSAIFLGNKTDLQQETDATKEKFKLWGISHYLARSGLHLVLLVIIWHYILGIFPISFIVKQFIIIFILLFYALFSWSSVSFERALLMLVLLKYCTIVRIPIAYLHVITLATLLILLNNPLQLFFLDFQLSFGITFALAWFNSIQVKKARISKIS